MSSLRQAHCAQRDEVAMLRKLARLREFITQVQAEMKRVTWPDFEQLRNATAVIIVFVFVVAGIIGLMDMVFRNVVNLIIGFFGA